MSNPIVTVQNQFIAAFSAIDGTGNYETELKKVYQTMMVETPEHPSISIVFATPQPANVMDDAGTVFDINMNFGIACFIQSDSDVDNSGKSRIDQFTFFSDIFRLIQSIRRTYISASPAWNINYKVPLEMTPVEPWNKNIAVFGVRGQIHIRNLNATLT
jgi:hypothetical protein